MFNFSKKKHPELKELKDKPEKGDLAAILIAGLITLVIPTILIVAAFYWIIYLIFS